MPRGRSVLFPGRRRFVPSLAAGGGGFTDPSSLPNLVAWYDASVAGDFSFSAGVVVSQWRDKSGNGRHMTPTLVGPNRTGTQNGLTIVYLDGKPMMYAGSNIVTGSTFTLCCSMRLDGTSQGTSRQFSCGSSSAGSDWGDASGLADNIETGPDSYPSGYRGGNRLSDHAPPLSGTWFLKTWVFNGTNSICYTGTTAETARSSTGSFDIDQWAFGQNHLGGSVGYSWLGEAAMYSDAKAGTDLSNLQSYMITRWAL